MCADNFSFRRKLTKFFLYFITLQLTIWESYTHPFITSIYINMKSYVFSFNLLRCLFILFEDLSFLYPPLFKENFDVGIIYLFIREVKMLIWFYCEYDYIQNMDYLFKTKFIYIVQSVKSSKNVILRNNKLRISIVLIRRRIFLNLIFQIKSRNNYI